MLASLSCSCQLSISICCFRSSSLRAYSCCILVPSVSRRAPLYHLFSCLHLLVPCVVSSSSPFRWVLATFIFCEGFVVIDEVGCRPQRGEEGSVLSCWCREGSDQSHFDWLETMPLRQDPAVSPPVIHVPEPAAKPVEAFRRHKFADSSAHVPCTFAEREALTVVATVCDGERSSLLWLPVHSSCEVQHVQQNSFVDFCWALGVLSGCIQRFQKQHTFIFWHVSSIQLFPLLVQCNGLMYIHTSIPFSFCKLRCASTTVCTDVVFDIFSVFEFALSLMCLGCATEMSFLPRYTVKRLRHKLIVIIGPPFCLRTSSITSLFVKTFFIGSHMLPSQKCNRFRIALSLLAGPLAAL